MSCCVFSGGLMGCCCGKSSLWEARLIQESQLKNSSSCWRRDIGWTNLPTAPMNCRFICYSSTLCTVETFWIKNRPKHLAIKYIFQLLWGIHWSWYQQLTWFFCSFLCLSHSWSPSLFLSAVSENWLKLKSKKPVVWFNLNYTDHKLSGCRMSGSVKMTENIPSVISDNIYCKNFKGYRETRPSCLFLQVHDHEGVLARGAITETDLQAAGRRSRPCFINDLHRCRSYCTAAAHW